MVNQQDMNLNASVILFTVLWVVAIHIRNSLSPGDRRSVCQDDIKELAS